jgi:hypothetical protein
MSNLVDARYLRATSDIVHAVKAIANNTRLLSKFRDVNQVYQILEINGHYLYKDKKGDVYIKPSYMEEWDPAQQALMTAAMVIHCAMVDLTRPRGLLVAGIHKLLSDESIWIKPHRKLNGSYNYTLFHAKSPEFSLLAYSDTSGVLEMIRGEVPEPEPEPEPLTPPEPEEIKEYVQPPVYEQGSFFSDLRYLETSKYFTTLQKTVYTLAERRGHQSLFMESLLRSEHLSADGSEYNPVFFETIKNHELQYLMRVVLRLHKFFAEYGRGDTQVIAPEFKQLVQEHTFDIAVEQMQRDEVNENFVKIRTGNGWVYVKTDATVGGKAYIKPEKKKEETPWTQSLKVEIKPQRVYQMFR